MPVKANVAVLVSGGGTNLQAILDAEKQGNIPSGKISLVVSNNPEAYAIERAKRSGVDHVFVLKRDYPDSSSWEKAIIDILDKNHIDLIVLAGFMSILSKDFIKHFENRIINVHPSLIPAFCGQGFYGLKVHEAALKYGVKVSGATVHFVNEIPDGGKIIAQKAVEVLPDDTPEILQQRIMENAEWILLPKAVEDISGQIIKEQRK